MAVHVVLTGDCVTVRVRFIIVGSVVFGIVVVVD